MSIHTESPIDAPVESIRAVLTDLTAYHEWNPHIASTSGRLAVDELVTRRVQQSGRRPQTVRCRVTPPPGWSGSRASPNATTRR